MAKGAVMNRARDIDDAMDYSSCGTKDKYVGYVVSMLPSIIKHPLRLKGALAVIDFDGCITADEGTSTL